MKPKPMLTFANSSMVITLVTFCVVGYLAWFHESEFPLMVVAVMHLLQIVLAGAFKLSYVLRLIAQDRLGLQLR